MRTGDEERDDDRDASHEEDGGTVAEAGTPGRVLGDARHIKAAGPYVHHDIMVWPGV